VHVLMRRCVVCADVNEDRRREPPNPREPVELPDSNVRKKQAAEHPANVANQSQQLLAATSVSRLLAAQVYLLMLSSVM